MTGWAAAAFDGVARRKAVERLQENRRRLTELGKNLRNDLAEARRVPNAEDYSPEGLERMIAHRQDLVRRKLGEQITQIKAQIAGDADLIRRQAEQARPQLGTDALALQRAQVKWDQVRMRLEAGMSIQHVLAGADVETAIAVREWGPAYLEAQAYSSRPTEGHLAAAYEPPDTTALMRSIDARLAQVGGPEVAATLEALREADVVAAGAGPVLQHLEQVAAGTDTHGGGLSAAIESSLAANEARAYYASQEAAATASQGLPGDPAAASGGDAA